MSASDNLPEQICASVIDAATAGECVDVRGGGSKRFLDQTVVPDAKPIDTTGWQGIIEYHPEELVLRARAGTALTEVVDLLAEHGQMLGCEPPCYPGATLGGAIATGLSGSRRPYAGAVRDYVLGVGLVTADGTYQEFGGQVMKNVAGYDVSRLVTGSFGMLGIIADVSLKVLPAPEVESSVRLSVDLKQAQNILAELSGRVSTLSASCYLDGVLYVRLSGSEIAVAADQDLLQAEVVDSTFWRELDCRSLEVFSHAKSLWRLSTDPLESVQSSVAVCDWGFAQRWVVEPSEDPRSGYEGPGHWTCWRTEEPEVQRHHPLPARILKLHHRLKDAFDPNRIINPSRMYAGL